MKFTTKTSQPESLKSDLLVALVFGKELSNTAKAIDKASKGGVQKALKLGDFTGKEEQTLLLTALDGVSAKRVLLVGGGEPKNLKGSKLKKLMFAIFKAAKGTAAKQISVYLEDLPHEEMGLELLHRIASQWASNFFYSFDEFKSKKEDAEATKTPPQVQWMSTEKINAAIKKSVTQGEALGEGSNFARTLGNLPGNICHPTYLADQAKAMAKTYEKLTVKIVDEKQLEKMGAGAFCSVSKGSEQPGKLILMEYNGGKANAKPHVLVGKGITFDTGGISLKPGLAMDEMKYDMCGAASVFGTMKAISEMNLPINVVGAVVAAENMPSGRASRPGDIVTSLSGQTIEILNTDAEGRLVLCDGLTYIGRYKPASVVDIATLTGACVVALGDHAAALYSNDDSLAEALLEAGKTAQDRAWHMPLWDEYQPQLDSPFADMANIGGPKAGSITAACFLSRFTKEYKWAHLDIAGVAWETAPVKGASGRPVALLTQYLMDQV